ncbi:MAG: hypothetical protein A3K11_13475 [Nitrospirae bacterium RIFCSPLOWO2_12_FULL_63_8]|nr:MAG: hypothetical protein A3K11_13475 [Nitrospirae bacterium RIFCSPLOWO2_12_FULL_63_8]
MDTLAMDATAQTASEQRNTLRVRRFTVGLTIGLIIVINALFLLVLRGSGLDLDRIFAERDFFDPVRDVCLRLAWYNPVGEKEPVRLCQEWINLGDPSGKVYRNQQDMVIVKGADGKVYAKEGAGDGRLVALVVFLVALVAGGMWLQRHLIARYRSRLSAAAEKNP